VARQASREAITIATGLPRAEIEQRAQRAFESANDIRARLRGLPDTAKRAHAVSRARTWADILQHMDTTGEPEFCGCLHNGTPPIIVQAVWIAWDWLARLAWPLNVAALAQACRDVLGAEPITFYQWPEPPPGIEPTPAARAAGAGTAPGLPGTAPPPHPEGYDSPGAYSQGPPGTKALRQPPMACSHPWRDRRASLMFPAMAFAISLPTLPARQRQSCRQGQGSWPRWEPGRGWRSGLQPRARAGKPTRA
jgi:hypothetical protein